MKLNFKPDFEETQQRWMEFWRGENKRPLVSIIVPKPGVKISAPPKHLAGLPREFPPDGRDAGIKYADPPAYLRGYDGNFQPVIDQLLEWADAHDFIGEAIPGYYLEFGPDTFSAYLGADLQIDPETGTSWCVPFVQDLDDAEFRFRRDGHWWQLTVEFMRAVRAQCDGKLLIVPPTLVANLDALSAIRGTQELMVDMALSPEKVKRALEAVCRAHTEIFNAIAQEFGFDVYGSLNIEATYTTGRHSRPQCDASCMISSPMFQEFALPCLEREAREQDAVVYHLDGPGALHHVEVLCGIEKLDIITWMPGTGNEHKDWSELYRKIDRLGKGQIMRASHAGIKAMWRQFQSRKLFFWTEASSRGEAEDFIAELEKLEKMEPAGA
ncbi:MAG: hypothetical protein ACREUU_05055 [Gammaproteobacteria bacterium]